MANSSNPPKKSLGQNFLINSALVDAVCDASGVNANDTVLEIGPGSGVITRELAKRAKQVFAVDLDKEILKHAQEYCIDQPNITFIHHDILSFDVSGIPLPYKVVGAIPYNITSPIVHTFLFTAHAPESLTLIIQKEVADKMSAVSPNASYLSQFLSFNGKLTVVKASIKPGSFNPPPKVTSSLVHFEVAPERAVEKVKAFSDFLHLGFSHPRKMLTAVFDENDLTASGVLPSQRPSELTLDQWLQLFKSVRE